MPQFMRDYPKGIKKLIRQYAAMAYEIELSRELKKLSCRFDDWKQGKISSIELAALIDEFNSEPSHGLFNQYNSSPLDMTLAHAISNGVINKSEVPDELLQYLNHAIHFYQAQVSNAQYFVIEGFPPQVRESQN
jgi:hypothetical protein